jgi:hypothetical protein
MLPLTFALLGVAFAAWALLAYALSAFLGALFRRAVPAMAVTLVLYVVLAIATATAVRPHYATPVTVPGAPVGNGGGWVISEYERAPDGTRLSPDALYSYFRHLPASVQDSADPGAFSTWLNGHGYTSWTALQPGSRFWEFQLIEGGWLLGLSSVLIGGTVWLVRRRGA